MSILRWLASNDAARICWALAAGYLLGRLRPWVRLGDWANWQRYGNRPTGLRYAAAWSALSVENITWLVTHPSKGWHAWRHRNDPSEHVVFESQFLKDDQPDH